MPCKEKFWMKGTLATTYKSSNTLVSYIARCESGAEYAQIWQIHVYTHELHVYPSQRPGKGQAHQH